MENMLELIKSRRTIRKYLSEQIKDEELNAIVEAGLYAPSAGGRQNPKFLIIQNEDILQKLGIINRNAYGKATSDSIRYVSKNQPSIADTNDIKTGFYNAPTVIAIFAPRSWCYAVHDCTMAAESMTLMAWSLGIGSCYVSRSEETFDTDYGREIMKQAGIEEDYEAKVFLTLGYPDGEIGNAKPRKENRIVKI